MLHSKPKKKLKIWRWIILLIFLFVLFYLWDKRSIDLYQDVIVAKWESFSKFTKDLWFFENILLKVYIKRNWIDLSKIAMWNYSFSGEYSKAEFINLILVWPKQDYKKYTILEWWSTYDIDYDLSQKWLIKKWQYLSFISDVLNINNFKERFWFLQNLDLKNLEWFLYPDTYNIDVWQDFLTQLLELQLQNFDTRVRKEYKDQINNFWEKLVSDWFKKLSWYDTLILSTVVEKEERNSTNKPTIVWLFLNRLNNGMRLDADITLCYWLGQPYEICTPAIIVKNLYDEKNVFNTRQVAWIPPQPICNPSVDTIESVLNYQKSDYLFYLHDSNWQIHFAKDVQWHSQNKNLYLSN